MLAVHCLKEKQGEPQRGDEFDESGKIVTIDVWSKGAAAGRQWNRPIQFSIEREVLNDRKSETTNPKITRNQTNRLT